MRKIVIGCLLYVSGTAAFAVSNSAFQAFDDEYNLGYSVANTEFTNGANDQTLQQSQAVNLEVERLFDIGVWMDVDANIVVSQNSLGNQASGTGQGNSDTAGYPGMPSSQDPNLGGINAKVGYAFPILPEHLQVTPYVLVGRNSNLAMSTMVSNGYENITNDYYYTGGIGGRIEYRINQYVFVYGDQLASYNWDQSGPVGGVQPQNNMAFVSTIGAKFNVVKNLQLGIRGFYTNYQAEASPPSPTSSNNGGTNSNGDLVTIYQPTSTLGAMFSIGLTY
ncbi:MAG: hypothetical protein QG673_1548 [Pseudomonadota bacterium]|nr:hypothetical protein [Pseudomonadota bacterium]